MRAWELHAFLVGLAAGVTARVLLVRVDYRQYPSYPHNFVVHLTTGVIAAVIGAVFYPALLSGEYTAVTFLVLAATQFREVRSVERETLLQLERALLVPRGVDYIEGIASVFEARNYLVMAAAAASSVAAVLGRNLGDGTGLWLAGALVGTAASTAATALRSGHRVGDSAVVRSGRLRLEGAEMYVDDIFIMNVGTEESREAVRRWGRGFRIVPRDESATAKLAHPGQRQAILHDTVAVLGMRKDIAMPELTPMMRQDVATGQLGVFITPAVGDDRAVIGVMSRVPLLESARAGAPGPFGVRSGRGAG